MNATYLKDNRGESLNSLKAKAEGRFPASYWAKQLGKGITAADIIEVLERLSDEPLEWHHTGGYAAITPFFSAEDFEPYLDLDDEDEEITVEPMEFILAARDARLAASRPATLTVWASWPEWIGRGRYTKKVTHEYSGEAVLKGDWLHFEYNGQKVRKNVTGRWFRWRAALEPDRR